MGTSVAVPVSVCLLCCVVDAVFQFTMTPLCNFYYDVKCVQRA
jgi:hypothetical protein